MLFKCSLYFFEQCVCVYIYIYTHTLLKKIKGTMLQNKTPRQALSGLLQPLPVPHRPWSHISLDFVTGLPLSDGNPTILMVVDRFSKAAHFIPLPKLLSAKETAQLMVQHVFRIHGLPVDIVSDWHPQFSSRFWKAFCTLIGSSASLSSRVSSPL